MNAWKISTFTILLMSVLIVGHTLRGQTTGANLPDETLGRQQFSTKLLEELGTNAELAGFTKANGETSDEGNGFELNYTADVHFLHHGYLIISPGAGPLELKLVPTRPMQFHIEVSPDALIRIRGKEIFRRTENGWMMTDCLQSSISASENVVTKRVIHPHEDDFSGSSGENVEVKAIRELTDVFSPRVEWTTDWKNIIYCTASIEVLTAQSPAIIVRSVDTLEVTKRIPIPFYGGNISRHPSKDIIVCGPCWQQPRAAVASFVFVDLETGKVTPVEVPMSEFPNGRYKLFWTEPNKLLLSGTTALNPDVSGATELNLDSLQLTTPATGAVTSAEAHRGSLYQSNENKNWVLKFNQPGLDPSLHTITVTTRDGSYAHELYNTNRMFIQVNWTPDHHYIVVSEEGNMSDDFRRMRVIHLGLGATHITNFGLRHLELSPQQQQQLESAFNHGQRVWGYVFSARVNPLNNRLLGPSDSVKATGYFTALIPKPIFHVSYDTAAVTSADVLSRLLVVNQFAWNNEVWAELVGSDEGGAPSATRPPALVGPDAAPSRAQAQGKPSDEISRVYALVRAGDLTSARDAANVLLEANGSNVRAVRVRITARAAIGDMEGALNDAVLALKLSPDWISYFDRGILLLATGRPAEAIPVFERAARSAKSPALYLWLARSRNGQGDAANTELRAVAGTMKRSEDIWTWTRMRYATGEVSDDELVSAAGAPRKQLQAMYLIAAKAELAKNWSKANHYFTMCVGERQYAEPEYWLARSDLNSLGK